MMASQLECKRIQVTPTYGSMAQKPEQNPRKRLQNTTSYTNTQRSTSA